MTRQSHPLVLQQATFGSLGGTNKRVTNGCLWVERLENFYQSALDRDVTPILDQASL